MADNKSFYPQLSSDIHPLVRTALTTAFQHLDTIKSRLSKLEAKPDISSSNLSLPVFPDNAAALKGGLTVGRLFRTGGDPDLVLIVH